MASARDILEDRLVELLYADGELAPEAVERLEAELDAYPDLRARLEEWRALQRALVDEALPDPDPQVHYNVLREARKLAAEREEAKAPRWLLWLESLTLGPAFAGAAVAMVALGGLVFSLRSSDEAPAMAPAVERAAAPAAADPKLAKTAAPPPEEAPASAATAVGAEPRPVEPVGTSRSLATGDSLKNPFGSLAGGRAEEQKGGAAKDDGFALGTRGAARGDGSNSSAGSARSRGPASPKAERKPAAKAKRKRRPAPSKKAAAPQKPYFAPPPPPADRAEPEPEPAPLADDFDGPAGGEGAGWGDVDEPAEVAPQQQAAPAAEPAPAPAPRRASASDAQRETYGLENDVDTLDAPARPGGADEASALLDDGAIGEAEAEEVPEYAARDAEQAPAAVETATKDTVAKEKASRTRRQDTAGPDAELAEARRLRSARDWRRAVQQYEQFIRGAAQHPQVGRAMVEAAGVYETLGDLDRADALYRRAAAFGGATGEQAREGRKRIAERRAQQRSKKAAPDVLEK